MERKSESTKMSDMQFFLNELDKMGLNLEQIQEITGALSIDRLSIEEVKKYLLNEMYTAKQMASIRAFLREDKLSGSYILGEISRVSANLKKDADIESKRRILYCFLMDNDFGNFKAFLPIDSELLTNLVCITNEDGFKELAIPFALLKKLDLSNLDFSNLNIYGFDFSNATGVYINPQTVYNKDLRKGNFNGVTFTGPFDEALINGSDFTGSYNAVIDEEKINYFNVVGFIDFTDPVSRKKWERGEVKNIIRPTILNDTTFIGSEDVLDSYNNVIKGNVLVIEKGKKLVRK